uniref:Uncharacterized protein n=1 Tax=Panagrolaimus sp. ES5 TaxID=591445 RepID=A0AC34FKH8_9BILA
MEQGNFFNQSHYQSLPNNEVNWGMLAQQWIHQNRPNPDQMQRPQHQQQQHPQSFHRPPGPPPQSFRPPHGGNHPSFFNNQSQQQQQQLGPMFSNHYPPQRPPYPPPQHQHQYPPRMDYYHGPPQAHPYHQMPPQPPPPRGPMMGRPPSLFDVRPQWNGGGPEFSQRPLHPGHEQYQQHPRPQAPLFPSAANTRPSHSRPNEQDLYNWPEIEAPPPPPPPTWLDSNATKDSDGDYSGLDTNERKQLPAWIREGLEQMEKEKRLREEKEERRKLHEAAEKAREEARKAKGKSKFDSDSEEEVEKEPVRRKFEEYPDRRPLSAADKEHLTNETVKSILIELLLESTKKLLKNCSENALNSVKTKRAKVVVNKKTSALAALATLGGSSSEEEDEDNDDGTSEIVKSNDEKHGKSGETKVEAQKGNKLCLYYYCLKIDL